MARIASFLTDPMIAVLLLATIGGIVLPVEAGARPIAQDISSIGIFLLFLVNGIRVARSEFTRALASWRYFLPLLLFVFVAMPLAGLGFSRLAAQHLPPLVALGFLYLGTLPSTIQSATSYTTLAGGNIALAAIGAALINLVGIFITAPIFALLGGGGLADLGHGAIGRIALIVVLPFMIGQAVQHWARNWVIAQRHRIVWLDRAVIGIAVYVAFSGAVDQGLGRMFATADWLLLGLLVGSFLVLAKLGAWLSGGLLGLSRGDRIAFVFAGAQKSVAVGAPLAAILFTPDVAGFVITPLLLYHLMQLLIAAPLARRLKPLDHHGYSN